MQRLTMDSPQTAAKLPEIHDIHIDHENVIEHYQNLI